jgi:hypothetical protein
MIFVHTEQLVRLDGLLRLFHFDLPWLW